MIDKIFKFLNKDKYSVINYNDKVSISHVSTNKFGEKYIEQESAIEIKKVGERTFVRRRFRNQYECEFVVHNELEIVSHTIILCYKYYEITKFTSELKDILLENLKNGHYDIAVQKASNVLSKENFSVFTKKEKAICLLQENDLYTIKYYSENLQIEILTTDELWHAYMVLFNFTNKLNTYNNIYNKMVDLKFIENDCEETYNYYLNIYL